MTTKHNKKHLTATQRILIEDGLNKGLSLAAIGRLIEKDPTTVSKEVKKYRSFQPRDKEQLPLKCARFKECSMRFLCNKKNCSKLCKSCFDASSNYKQLKCTLLCPDYLEQQCEVLTKAPHVCNACSKIRHCNKTKAFYIAHNADKASQHLLVSCRSGLNQEPADIAMLDALISPLLKQGQSLAHIYAFHGHEIPCCRKTLYNYIDQGVFTARNMDLRRRVRYKCKPRKKGTRISLVAREFRIGRTYDDFQKYTSLHPELPVVEMDTVEGGKGNSTQVFLTMLFRSCHLMLIFVLAEKTQACVTQVFDTLCTKLGTEVFRELFPVILTDNGIEFQFPPRLECSENGEIRTKIFYCNPNSSWQKGMIEKNHQYIREVIPKGKSLDSYDQTDATLLMNHINSEARDSLNGCTPFQLSQLLLNSKLHHLLKLVEIPPNQVTLKPTLLQK